MAIDPRKLKPGELCRLLNSTPLGEVINERQLLRHRTSAGYRVSSADGKTVDLFAYVAWLCGRRHAPRPVADDGLTGYDAMRERARERNKALSLSGRNIGELPEVVDPQRKARCERSFKDFCDVYFPCTFKLPWSDDHIKVIAKIERAVLEGGLFAMAMPRGSGKTSLCETACLWAMIYGHREYVALIGSDEAHAATMLDSIKSEIEHNDLLLDDFPEVCFPVRCLDRIHQRASGQLYRGEPTLIGWTAGEVILPTIPGSKASGAIIAVAGITGRIRGMKHKRSSGESIRPSLVLVDDPQTDESARSPSQCASREHILAGAVLGLAGPGNKIAGLMTLTVVRPDDLADRLLNRDKHPQWQGERTRMVYEFPSGEKMWAEYARLRAEGLKADRGTGEATEYYRQNQAAMDAGATVAWPARFNPDELSAIQHAMNLRLQNEAAFFAEYQNDPLPDVAPDNDLLSADQIAAKTNGMPRGSVPIACTRLTMFVDVQGKALFWMVVGWEDNFSGSVIDYGTEPEQGNARGVGYFTLRDIRRSLATAAPRAGAEGALYAGLERLCDRTLGREWRRDGGVGMRIDRCLIDANWGSSTNLVYKHCRESKYAAQLLPSHGRGVGASSIPFSEYTRKPGDRVGLHWRMPVGSTRAVRHVLFDTNFWKTFIQARLAVAMGDPGSLSLYGHAAEAHRLLAEHLTSEYRVKTEGRGRTVDEWKLLADGRDNHWLDCLVGCAVAASMQGATLAGVGPGPRPRKRVSLSEMQRAAQQRRGRR